MFTSASIFNWEICSLPYLITLCVSNNVTYKTVIEKKVFKLYLCIMFVFKRHLFQSFNIWWIKFQKYISNFFMDSTTKSLVPHAQNTHAHTRSHTCKSYSSKPFYKCPVHSVQPWGVLATPSNPDNTPTRASECVTQERRNEGRLSPTFPTKKGKGESVLRGLGSISPTLLRTANANVLA